MKSILWIWVSLMSVPAFATELTPVTLIGDYTVEAQALFKHFYGNIFIQSTDEFEFQRTYPDGKKDPRCQGNYTLVPGFVFLDGNIQAGKILQGYATCPNDRQKKLDFRIEFGNTTVEDLQKGTTVQVRSSLSGGVRVNAFVKKQ